MSASYNSGFAYNATGRIYNDAGSITVTTPGVASYRARITATLLNRNRTSSAASSRSRTSTTMRPR